VAIVVVFLVLTIRQALIIVLIVISPIAFVAFLLPNTEGLFKKWQSLLTTLLLMFPVIAAIFGASALASKVIMSDANASYAVQIMGALVAIVPLALTPIVMKAAGGTLGSIGAKIQGLSRTPSEAMNKSAADIRKRELARMDNLAMNRPSSGIRNIRGRFLRYNARRDTIAANQERELTRGKAGYIAGKVAEPNSDLLKDMVAGGTAGAEGRAQSSALSALSKIEDEEMQAEAILLKESRPGRDELRVLSSGGKTAGFDASKSVASQATAMDSMVASNDVDGINNLWNESKSWTGANGDKLRSKLADSLQSSSSRPTYLGQGAIAKLRLNQHDTTEGTIKSAIEQNAYSAAKIASADGDELTAVSKIAYESGTVSQEAQDALANNAVTAMNTPSLSTLISKNIGQVTDIGQRGSSSGPKSTGSVTPEELTYHDIPRDQ
ncbi:MAG TPA: hypothetical protein VMR16_03425, partial [Candidatus Saccharimonadales bacterium]|nr:hypothetical protein [Candidatus Saccharimonadales bacterium]